MFRVFRSLIKVTEADDLNQLRKNWDAFEKANLEIKKTQQSERIIATVIRKFYLEEGEPPELEYIRNELAVYLDSEEASGLADVLKDHALLTAGSFRKTLKDKRKARYKKDIENVLKDHLLQLNTSLGEDESMEDRIETVVQGVTGEVYKVIVNSREEQGSRTYGIVNDDMIWLAEKRDKERKEGQKLGQLTGYEILDMSFRGFKKGEAIYVAGSTAEGKTELCRNIAYNQVVNFGYNVFIWSGEMLYEQMLNAFLTIHSADSEKWGRTPLDYSKVRDAIITDDDQKFINELAEDWHNNDSYGSLIIEQPTSKVTLDTVMSKAYIEHLQLEHGLDLIIIDYPTLLDYDDIEELYKAIKRHAIMFGQGRGIPIVSPVQINRSGKKHFAEKFEKSGDATYNLFDLAGTAEVERNADKVLGVASPQSFKDQGIMKIMDLKARDDPAFEPHFLQVVPGPRKILNSSLSMGNVGAESEEADGADVEGAEEEVRDLIDGMQI